MRWHSRVLLGASQRASSDSALNGAKPGSLACGASLVRGATGRPRPVRKGAGCLPACPWCAARHCCPLAAWLPPLLMACRLVGQGFVLGRLACSPRPPFGGRFISMDRQEARLRSPRRRRPPAVCFSPAMRIPEIPVFQRYRLRNGQPRCEAGGCPSAAISSVARLARPPSSLGPDF